MSTRPHDLRNPLDAAYNQHAERGLADLPPTGAKEPHPPGLYLLFVTEMWERFSYYGMRAFLMLFMTASVAAGGLGWGVPEAGSLYGWYTGLVYLTTIGGGYLADRLLGTHWSMVLGGSIIALGHFTLAFHGLPAFYTGLALIIVGTGLFKPCVSVMVGQLYREKDVRRDSAYTIFYMGINLGAFLGPIVCGWLRVKYGWHWGFAAAGVGMVLGLIVYFIGRPYWLKGIGLRTAGRGASRDKADFLACAKCGYDLRGLPPDRPCPECGSTVRTNDARHLTRVDKHGIAAIFIMAFFIIFFWTAFEQAGSSMNLFAEHRTDRTTPGWLKWVYNEAEYPAEWFQSVNSAFILLLAPFFAAMWLKLGRAGREPSTPVKFAVGLILLGVGFIFMMLGAAASESGGNIIRVSAFYLIAAYCVHTMGELCLSPVGLSMITKLAPVRFVSLMMGVWFLATGAANKIAGTLAGSVEEIEKKSVTILGYVLQGQELFFSIFVVVPIGAGLLLLILSPGLKRLMHGRA